MNAPDLLRLPPHSVEAEQSLLGGLLLDNNAWDRMADLVTEADFYRDDHRRIFRHMALFCHKGMRFDVVVLHEAIERSNEADQTGGLAYLGEIANNTPSAANIRRYAEIVRDKALMRKLVMLGDDIAAQAMSAMTPEEVMDKAETGIVSLAQERIAGKSEANPLADYLGQAIDELQQEFDSDTATTGLSYGLVDLDALTGGMMPGDMIVIAGRPSMGKTALMLNIVEHVAIKQKKPKAAVVFSLEMTGKQLAKRLLASAGSVNGTKLRNAKKLNDDDWTRITSGLGHLHNAPIEIDDNGSLTMPMIRARAKKLQRKYGGLGLVLIDYLQLLSSHTKSENRTNEVSEMSRAIKALAKELECPVVALSQLSRKVEERPNKRPMMSDLRESGAIEQDADQILLLYRDDYYNQDSLEKGLAEINVAKNREGEVGTVKVVFRKEYGRMVDLDPQSLQEIEDRKAAAKAKPTNQFKD